MTGWNIRAERHIPEEELHAYLDQALSRSQCAEIETHLSSCRACQAARASAAALRDRTTALLSNLTPRPVIVPPSYLSLSERHSRRLAIAIWHARIRRSAMWAAAVVAAVGSGWIARTVTYSGDAAQVAVPVAQAATDPAPVAPQPAPAEDPTAELEREATPAPLPEARTPLVSSRSAGAPEGSRRVLPPPTLQLASVATPVTHATPVPTSPELAAPMPAGQFGRLWRVVPWEDALQIAGSGLPFIEGLTVVGVLFQPGGPGERPTVIVAQQNAAGEVIHSIEGPADRVKELVRNQSGPDVHASESARTPPDYVDEPGSAPRRVLRILTVTGRLPVDSLNALARVATIR